MGKDRKSKESKEPGKPEKGVSWKEFKAQKRKWHEEKLIAKLEKNAAKKVEEVERKKAKVEEEERLKTQGRKYTVSIALPGSILDNAQSPELRTYLVGQIARAATVFNVDEIIVFNEYETSSKTTEGEFKGIGKKGNCNVQMARILQYLECPQYLRKSFFPQHDDLRYAGVLNPLDSPHHMKADETPKYREGVVVDAQIKEGRNSYTLAGIIKNVEIDRVLMPGMRVTIQMDYATESKNKVKGFVVPPDTPRTRDGIYWGYQTRLASSLSEVFTETPFPGGYDLTIGTSERGGPVDDTDLPHFKHLLVVFGGLGGLEAALEADPKLNVQDPSLLFQHYLNTCPEQGSGTIRTEEAILISMAALRPKIMAAHNPTS